MADRVFKGRLICTGDIHDENTRAFPEASEDFRKPHKGGLDPFWLLYGILRDVQDYYQELAQSGLKVKSLEELQELEKKDPVREVGGSIWISGHDAWIKVDKDGSFEIGTPGV